MEDDKSVETHYNLHVNTRQESDYIQKILDQISRNSKDLEGFLNLNSKLRNAVTELTSSYLVNNEERLKFFYQAIKDYLRNIEINSSNFNKISNSVQYSGRSPTSDEFNFVFAEKNFEISENLVKSEFNNKYNFTISMFKSMIDNKKDEILREVLKDDYIHHIRNTYGKILAVFKQPFQQNEKVNDISQDIIEELNKKFSQTLQILRMEKDTHQFINITVNNSFIILIKVSKEYQYSFDLSVCGIDEYTNMVPNFERKERKFANILKKLKVEEKSQFKVMRKISILLEDRLGILLRFVKTPFKMGFFLFVNWISSFNDIFKKKCSFCKRSALLSTSDKCFYPPLYKFMDLDPENSHHFHEDCYNIINSIQI